MHRLNRLSFLSLIAFAVAASACTVQEGVGTGGRLIGDDDCLPGEDGACRTPGDVCADGDVDCPDPLPPMLGCDSDRDCNAGFFCQFPTGSCPDCGDDEHPLPTPSSPEPSDPDADGTDRDADGTTPPDGESGEGHTGDEPPPDHGGPSGLCVHMSEACIEIYDPVCGCDGVTYDNDCFAAAAGVSILKHGQCDPPTGGECGGALDFDCDENSYCAYPPEAACGRTGISAVCLPRPEACPDNWDPVCGCDGETYSNECDAAAAGTAVDYAGECGGCSVEGEACADGGVCQQCWGSLACVPEGAIC